MSLKSFFKLEKLKITDVDAKLWDKNKNFEAMFNPETYSLKYQNEYLEQQGINTEGREALYSLSKPGQLSLKLILDDSGVSDFAAVKLLYFGKRDVYKQVQKFLKLCFHMDGETHQPKRLRVEWGDLDFECRLDSVDVAYSMFNRGGEPIRAELDVSFIGDIKDSKRVLKENKSSPDLTHLRTVKSGDTLPLLSKEIYGDPSYCLEVARVNKLDNPRRLKPGIVLKFPPLDKGVSK